MTNNERFNAMINSCENPRAVLEALRVLTPIIRSARSSSSNQQEGNNVEILTVPLPVQPFSAPADSGNEIGVDHEKRDHLCTSYGTRARQSAFSIDMWTIFRYTANKEP